MTFDFYSFRFEFVARDPVYFPAGMPGNILRGAFGSVFRKIACSVKCPGMAGRDVRECEARAECSYARIFEPAAIGAGPSGLSDWPRPVVFRAAHLVGCKVAAGESFFFDVNVFEMRDPALAYFVLAFAQLAREGLGPRRGRADLVSVRPVDAAGGLAAEVYGGPSSHAKDPGPPISVRLEGEPAGARKVRVEFATPTELKSGQEEAARPEFPVLFARARDRVSTLRALYGAGPLEIDFAEMGRRAAAVRMTRCDLRRVDVERRSSRTGQVHGIGGFVGVADYEGDLGEFVPYLEAAHWTGVGRQCVWGKGEVRHSLLAL